MGTDPNSADNRWLLDAMREQIPVIYFLGTGAARARAAAAAKQ
jgi:putative restriction endonuclease